MASKNKTKLSNPSVSLSRDRYKFTLSFSSIDNDAKYIHIERQVFEKEDYSKKKKKWIESKSDHKTVKIGAKRNSSWSYTMNKDVYYPFVADGGDSNNKQSDLDQRVSKVVFKVWLTGIVNKKTIKSDTVTKTYKFDAAKEPTVGISFDSDQTSFIYGVDINDDYTINSNTKKVATRAWMWLTSKEDKSGATEKTVVSGKWYNNDKSIQVRNRIKRTISPDTPIRYTVHAYSAGPGGKSETKTASHVFARPLAPMAPIIKPVNVLKKSKVDNSYGIYDVSWNINTRNGWRPVDTVSIEYRDQTRYGEDIGNWSTAKSNIHSSIKKIQTDELGAPAANTVRYFRVSAWHDGAKVPGYVSGVVDYGQPSTVSNFKVEQTTIDGEQTLVFTWDEPDTQLYGTDADTKLYNGGTLGHEGRARIFIYRNTTNSKPIGKVYYGDTTWQNRRFEYKIPKSDIGKSIDYCAQLIVGRSDLNPGGVSEKSWAYNVKVPKKCTNVVATKQANLTAVELTWNNPETSDTSVNGVEVAWSTLPNVFESNSSPSTYSFNDGNMTKAYITGLSSGEVYYFWVRLFEENNGNTTYGLWSDVSEGVLLANKPNIPVLTTSRSWIKEGGLLEAQWIYYSSGNLQQTSAKVEISTDNENWTIVGNVIGEEDHCTIDLGTRILGISSAEFDMDGFYIPGTDTKFGFKYKYQPGEYYLRVIVSNVMGDAVSEPVELKIAEPPTSTLVSSSLIDYSYETNVGDSGSVETRTAKTLRSMPFNVTVGGNGDLNLYIYCVDNFDWNHPDKTDKIFRGDCIWTSYVEAGDYIIQNVRLADNCIYRLQLECTDQDTELKATTQFIDFEVRWEHQAFAPIDSTVSINEEGIATLTPVKPEGALDTDVCDIYRNTADGSYICAEGVKWGQVVTDVLPTFSDVYEPSYRFCTRTSDGDEAWSDVYYELDGAGLIINYENEVIKLPWNVTIDDSRSKNGEIRAHLGGTKTYFSQPYVNRTQSISAEVAKKYNEDLVEQLYEFSRYDKICYIRLSNGIGYPASVEVSMNRDYNNPTISISISTEEVDSNEFMGTISDVVDESVQEV